MGSKHSGDQGEKEVIRKGCCPNCCKKLMVLPPNYPLYDIQCTGCYFRAQIKTNKCRPKNVVFGAGWEIVNKVLKSGFITPPLILNFKWEEESKPKQEIRFYPFVPRKNLKHYKLSKKARRAGYRMFNYVEMDKVPFFIWTSSGIWSIGGIASNNI